MLETPAPPVRLSTGHRVPEGWSLGYSGQESLVFGGGLLLIERLMFFAQVFNR